MKTQKLLMLLAVMMAVILSVGMASAAELTHVEDVEVWSDATKGTFNVSVYPGKASYSGISGEFGDVSGVFGNGTVKDYRFFSTENDAMSSYVDGGAGIVDAVASPPGDNVAGNQDWADVWTATDPGGDFASAADFTNPTVAQAQNITGTIDISDLKLGTVYAIYGTYFDSFAVTLTMSGSGQPDITAEYALDPPNDVNRMWISSFDFDVTEGYDTITYTYTNADVDASRARFMGVIVTGLSYDEVEIIYPENGEVVLQGDVTLEWINIDPNANDAATTYVDVWFGTEPNKIGGDYTKVVSVQDISSHTITPPGSGVFYWQVDSYLNGKPLSAGGTADYSTGDPCMVEGIVYVFTNDAPVAIDGMGANMITWSGEPVTLNPAISDDNGSALTYVWTADPADGVTITDADTATPTVTVTKDFSKIVITNAGFEAVLTGEPPSDWGPEPPTGWEAIARSGTWNPPETAYTDSAVPEGVMCAWAQTIDGGLSQVLAETLTTETQYVLTVEVGNSNTYDWTGYKVQLLAGGAVIAEDNSTVSPALGTFEMSTVNYIYAPEDANKVGLPLEIRLLAGSLVAEGTYAECNFDDVRLSVTPDRAISDAMSTVTITLDVSDETNPVVTDTMTIDVYDTSCMAAGIGLGLAVDVDYNGNCLINPEDLAVMASAWLNDYSATDYVVEIPDVSLTISGEFGVLDLSANGGINPNTGVAWVVGDQYRLAFHTDGTINATSNDPGVYDAFATAEAAAAGLGGTWTAMLYVNTDGTQEQGVGPISSPLDRSGTGDQTGGAGIGGAGVPVYAMDGTTCIARNNADIYNNWSNPFDGDTTLRLASGSTNNDSDGNPVTASQNVHYSPFLDQFGLGDTANVHGADIWTGGFGAHVNAAGDTPSEVRTSHGNSNANTGGRTWNRFQRDNVDSKSLYAISEVLTVIVPVVEAGDKVSTWSGKEITMDPIVGDVNDLTAVFDYSWTPYPNDDPTLDIAISDPSIEAPTVTITKVPYLKPFVPNGGFENVQSASWVDSIRDIWGQYDRIPSSQRVRVYNPNEEHHFTAGLAAEGEMACRSATSGGDVESRPDGLAIILDAKFDPSANYTLTFAVGHPYSPTSTTYTETIWKGYLAQLVAGGEVVSTLAGYADEIVGGTVVAFDDNTVAVAQSSWGASSVVYTPNTADPALAGLPLQIRLLAKDYEDADDPNNTYAFFDDVKLLINGEAAAYVIDPGMRSVNMTLTVNKQGEAETASDSMVVDVYDDGCVLVKALDPSTIAVTDHNVDCITNLSDFVGLAENWLLDYALTEPAEKL